MKVMKVTFLTSLLTYAATVVIAGDDTVYDGVRKPPLLVVLDNVAIC